MKKKLKQIKRNAETKNKISINAKPFLLFDPVEDVPTLTHQTMETNVPKEINDTIAQKPESINEKLKEVRTELAEKLTDGPIKDLRITYLPGRKEYTVNDILPCASAPSKNVFGIRE